MSYLVRCPCCAAPKRVDPVPTFWDAHVVVCPRCGARLAVSPAAVPGQLGDAVEWL